MSAGDGGMSPAAVHVKEEQECDDIKMDNEFEASEAASASLYAEHEVKHELVLGPERLQPQDIAYTMQQSLQRTKSCSVKRQPAPGADTEAVRSGKSCKEQIMLLTSSGGSLRSWEHVDVVWSPRRPLRSHTPIKKALKETIHVAPAERAAEMDLDEEVGEGTVANNLDHVRELLGDLQAPEFAELVPHVRKTPSPPAADIVTLSGIFKLQSEPQVGPSVPCGATEAASRDADDRPSTSGKVETSRRPIQIRLVGNEFDSDFEDEFDVNEFAANVGTTQDIPDDEDLTEREIKIVNRVSRAMDEAVTRLVNVSVDFTWQKDFNTFRSVPEEFSGPTPGPIIDYDTPYEAFTSIWSTDFMEHIVLETNKYARQTIDAKIAAESIKKTPRLRQWTDTDVDEMYLLFAIYILMGLDKRTSQHEYWKTTGHLEMPKFRQLMTYNRFILLNRFIHFADNSNESQSLPQNEKVYPATLAKMAPVLDHLNDKFSKLYNLQRDVAIDESLTLFKGRLCWVQALRSRTACFGIKSYELCESRTGYMWKFYFYTGKNSKRGDIVPPSIDLAGKSAQAVLDLLKGLENRGHHVTMDNFYNCPALARYLKSLGFDCSGTLRPNRKHVPVKIAKAPKNVTKGTIIALHSGDVSCIAWKDSKMVCMISTYHNAETFTRRQAGRDLVKPISIRAHNTMGGVGLKDQKLIMHLERKRCVQNMNIFKRLLNVSVFNAFILLTESLRRRRGSLTTQRDFREQLADSLVEKHRHPSPQEIVATVSEVLRLRRDFVHVPDITLGHRNRGRCHICYRNGTEKRVNLKCTNCDEFLCPGDCWRDWHSLRILSGKDIKIRINRRKR